MKLTAKDRERFAERVDASNAEGCWLWTGRVNAKPNYVRGVLTLYSLGKVRSVYASRVAWTLANGPIAEGMLVCHHCDNPLCVRPTHLFLGTHKDNSQDMSRKGRARTTPLTGAVWRAAHGCQPKSPALKANAQRWLRGIGMSVADAAAASGGTPNSVRCACWAPKREPRTDGH